MEKKNKKSLSSNLKDHSVSSNQGQGGWGRYKSICNIHEMMMMSSGDDNGCSWPPRSYPCTYCKREFRSAQALGGHMNVHRRDRARLRNSPPPATTFTYPHSNNININIPHHPQQQDEEDYPILTLNPNPNYNPPPPPPPDFAATNHTLLSSSPNYSLIMLNSPPLRINTPPLPPISTSSSSSAVPLLNNTTTSINHNNLIDLELRLGPSS